MARSQSSQRFPTPPATSPNPDDKKVCDICERPLTKDRNGVWGCRYCAYYIPPPKEEDNSPQPPRYVDVWPYFATLPIPLEVIRSRA